MPPPTLTCKSDIPPITLKDKMIFNQKIQNTRP